MKKLEIFLKVLFVIVTIAFFVSLSIWYEQQKPVQVQQTASAIVQDSENVNFLNIGLLLDTQEIDFNPITNKDKTIYEVLNIVYDPLFKISDNGVIENLVNNYAAIANNDAYIFKLRDDIYWHNGEKLTSHDVKYTIEFLFQNHDSIYYKYLNNVQNIKVIDELTFRINLLEPEMNFEQNLIFPIITEKAKVGSGEYIIAENVSDNIIILNINAEHFNKSEYLNSINIFFYNTVWELCKEFKEGDLDIINVNSNEYINYLGEIGYRKIDYISFSKISETLLYSDKIYGTIKPDEFTIFQNINTWKKIIEKTIDKTKK